VPPQTRSAADVPDLHGPWAAAMATRLLQISDGTVTGGPALEGWPPGDAALLDAWLAGLRAVCQAMADPRQEDGVTAADCRAQLSGFKCRSREQTDLRRRHQPPRPP
jgi:hypothetical protein